ncbi:unnamed protein product [Acanthoscelides obtectus]|uniref:ditrans,polycis-polyprenyl diphosphate synthase [(2E,6E)-farnesyldiphosphate specific] n=1 Tax=Acanthoscelides obtectus TaxID=200917 RepID=A0A9P0QDB7_ACAOB|nr:unnamed protein product [Acanthoscelides obtectus]CAK1687247.1 Dehydrodolichyl diphosphate synthase complex subunit nus1 [Acanthoscelides obtectus]
MKQSILLSTAYIQCSNLFVECSNMCIKQFFFTCHEFLFPSEKRARLKELVSKIKKKPKHLTVLLGPEDAEVTDLANLVIWCLASQIVFISFYDHKGSLKKKEEKLQLEVKKHSGDTAQVIWYTDENSNLENGFKGSKVHVKIITDEDSKMSAATITKLLVESENEDFTIENIHKHFVKQFRFPDPEMGYYLEKTIVFIIILHGKCV